MASCIPFDGNYESKEVTVFVFLLRYAVSKFFFVFHLNMQ